MVKHVERTFAGRPLKMETGRLAKQAAGACLIQFGETVVLATVTVSDQVSTQSFFPLTVEYREKAYAAGKIPGGFLKREGRPSDEEILSARVADRTFRPLFPEGFKNEVQVFIYVLSADQENDADVLGVTAASAALTMSKVPWNGPVAAVRVGRVEGAWVVDPTFQQLEFSEGDMIVAGSADSIVMVEGGAMELTEAEIVKALEVAHKGIRELLEAADELVADVRQPKMEWTKVEAPAELVSRVKALAEPRIAEALNLPEKAERTQALAALKATIQEQLAAEFPDNGKDVATVIEDIEYRTMREQVLTHGERVDGRDLGTVRPITSEVGVLPRTHGSALFTRGQTQALVSVTLGTVSDEQRIDSIDVAQETTKSFMLHYNFPPFSTGEVRPIRGTSRREVGHGALAERALQALLPPYEQFPYTIRIVSDILESNGSSSMATVCGGSLALFDAGVPMTGAGAEINVDDSGMVTISAVGEGGERARDMIAAIVQEPEVGKVYEGVVKSTTAFGAFVEIIPGVEGLLHISELQHGRTERTEDVVTKGDHVRVKLLEVDERGRMRLSRKALMDKPEAAPARSH